jgi:NitT/TauT family transport system substrate-binding protein
MKGLRTILAVGAVVAVVVAACSGAATEAPKTKVRVLLQWVPQAQFAGYYAAQEQGFWDEEGLDVEIIPGGPDVIPQQVGSAADGPEFTTSWLPRVLEARQSASDLVNIAQIYQRSGTLSVSWKDSNITSPQDFAGKKVGVWDFGNEFEVTAAAKKYNLVEGTDFEKVIQAFDMVAFLNREIDVAEAMIYNEYAQVLETVNPDTGELYKPEDMNIIDYNDEGTAMLQDGIFARAAWLAEGSNKDTAVKFLKGAFRGWIYCRENADKCVDYVLAAGTALGKGHQAWQMNEVNPLIWPAPNGIGIMDKALYDQTVQIATDAGILTGPPSEDAYRTDLAEEALKDISEDTKGEGFQRGTVEVTEGGN